MSKLLLTVEEASERISLGRTTLFALMKRGEIRSIKVGKARRIVAASLDEFIQNRLSDTS